MSQQDHLHREVKIMPVKQHSVMAQQYLFSCHLSEYRCNNLVQNCPSWRRVMKKSLQNVTKPITHYLEQHRPEPQIATYSRIRKAATDKGNTNSGHARYLSVLLISQTWEFYPCGQTPVQVQLNYWVGSLTTTTTHFITKRKNGGSNVSDFFP